MITTVVGRDVIRLQPSSQEFQLTVYRAWQTNNSGHIKLNK